MLVLHKKKEKRKRQKKKKSTFIIIYSYIFKVDIHFQPKQKEKTAFALFANVDEIQQNTIRRKKKMRDTRCRRINVREKDTSTQ